VGNHSLAVILTNISSTETGMPKTDKSRRKKTKLEMKMKSKTKILLSVCLFFITYSGYSQTLTTTSSTVTYSGKCVERTQENFITMFKMSKKNFETQMKAIGAYITYTENFGVQASEQLAEGASLGSECFIFVKWDNELKVIWYGKENESGFKNLMEKLKPFYLGIKNNRSGYGVTIGNEKYVFAFSREAKQGTYYETLEIGKVE
jgi:hypothetical protein